MFSFCTALLLGMSLTPFFKLATRSRRSAANNSVQTTFSISSRRSRSSGSSRVWLISANAQTKSGESESHRMLCHNHPIDALLIDHDEQILGARGFGSNLVSTLLPRGTSFQRSASEIRELYEAEQFMSSRRK
ncbi:hypothetical protein KL910_004975 [Ogataea haglerorum]|nr:hypothetical protein KL945_004360 [Ogataea haglerorum]KAG7785141.1 hypothetical protein KL910_004975 [Ogataea haglerorum]